MRIDKRYLLVATILLFILHACGGGDENRYIVESDFKNSDNVPFVIVQENIDKGLLLDTLIAEKGFFIFASKADSLTKLNFYVWKYNQPIPIYVKNGERYELKGDLNNPYAIEVAGSSLNQTLSSFRASQAATLKALASIDTVLTTGARDSLQLVFDAAVIAEIAKNPSQPTSALLLADYLCTYNNHQVVDSLYQLLSPKAIPTIAALKIERFLRTTNKRTLNDQMYTFMARNHKDSLVNTHSYIDQPTIYLFWNLTDSVRNFKACKDVSILYNNFKYYDLQWVNVGLESDIGVWRNKLEERNIEEVGVQLNIPMGISSVIADSLGLLATPFFIVQDATGQIVSKGADATDFLNNFEKMMLPHILTDSLLIDSAKVNDKYRKNVMSRAAGGFYN